MNCYAWKIPEGCYDSALVESGLACPSVNWWWIAAAVAAGALLLGGGRKKPARARTVRARRRR